MNAVEIIALCKRKGIKLFSQDGSLKVVAEKGAMTPEISAVLKQNKPRLVEVLSGLTRTIEHRIPKIPRNAGLLPTSFSQQNLWLAHRLKDNETSYNATLALDVTGKWRQNLAEASINQIIQRHEPLRTNFVEVEGLPQQKSRLNSTFHLLR